MTNSDQMHIFKILMDGKLSDDGLTAGRLLLLEALRALTPYVANFVNSLLITSVETLGNRLLRLIKLFIKELEEVPFGDETILAESSDQPSTSRFIFILMRIFQWSLHYSEFTNFFQARKFVASYHSEKLSFLNQQFWICRVEIARSTTLD